MVLLEESHPLPFDYLQGRGSVPAIVVAIAVHITVHPESDLLDVLACNKSFDDARRDATADYEFRNWA